MSTCRPEGSLASGVGGPTRSRTASWLRTPSAPGSCKARSPDRRRAVMQPVTGARCRSPPTSFATPHTCAFATVAKPRLHPVARRTSRHHDKVLPRPARPQTSRTSSQHACW